MVDRSADVQDPRAGPAVRVEPASRLVRALLAAEVERLRIGGHQVGEDPFRGLYITDEEVDRLLGGPDEAAAPGEAHLEIVAALADFVGSEPRLFWLRDRFGLSPGEAACLVLCWVSEVDSGVERLVAYAQDDVTKRRPRVDLALRTLAPDLRQDALLSRAGPLRRWGLLKLHDEPGQVATPPMARSIVVAERVTAFLDGLGELAVELEQAGAQLHPGRTAGSAPLSAETVARVRCRPGSFPPLVHGPDRERLATAAALLVDDPPGAVLEVPVAALLAGEAGNSAADVLQLAVRESVLEGVGLFLTGLDLLDSGVLDGLIELLQAPLPAVPIVAGSAASLAWPGVRLEVAAPTYEERIEIWARELPSLVSRDSAEALASRFRLYTDEIRRAAAAADAAALVHGASAPSDDDVFAAARAQSAPVLSDLATKVPQFHRWDDLVLPPDTIEPLRELCASVEHRHTVLEEWGFSRKLSTGKGVIAMFVGESGTGKTMAADVAGGHLGLDLYKVDLSGIVSKYIGETEKNLRSVFAAAQRSNAILFFDEADALFGKRSEVKDAHDRYANIETAYLLQRMEQYEGMVILATNLRMNIDDAFLRRMHFVIDFPMPDEAMRKRLWHGVLPDDLPLASDVDFDFLARAFRLSGGNIRNIALGAAFLAAEEGSKVGMRHFVRSVRREYQKIGRMVTQSEFGRYWPLLQDA